MFYAHCQIVAEELAFEGKSLASRCLELFSVPRIRRASMASAWIVISQQFSGINIMVSTTCLNYRISELATDADIRRPSILRPSSPKLGTLLHNRSLPLWGSAW